MCFGFCGILWPLGPGVGLVTPRGRLVLSGSLWGTPCGNLGPWSRGSLFPEVSSGPTETWGAATPRTPRAAGAAPCLTDPPPRPEPQPREQ